MENTLNYKELDNDRRNNLVNVQHMKTFQARLKVKQIEVNHRQSCLDK
jgi:hypothetical protein